MKSYFSSEDDRCCLLLDWIDCFVNIIVCSIVVSKCICTCYKQSCPCRSRDHNSLAPLLGTIQTLEFQTQRLSVGHLLKLNYYSEKTYFLSDSYLQYSRVPVSHADPSIIFSHLNSMRKGFNVSTIYFEKKAMHDIIH